MQNQVSGQEKKRDRLRETQLLVLEKDGTVMRDCERILANPLSNSKINNNVPYP